MEGTVNWFYLFLSLFLIWLILDIWLFCLMIWRHGVIECLSLCGFVILMIGFGVSIGFDVNSMGNVLLIIYKWWMINFNKIWMRVYLRNMVKFTFIYYIGFDVGMFDHGIIMLLFFEQIKTIVFYLLLCLYNF